MEWVESEEATVIPLNVPSASAPPSGARAEWKRPWMRQMVAEAKIAPDDLPVFAAEFEVFLRNFHASCAERRVPEKPRRDYRPRENILDYLRSDEGFGPWLKAGLLTRPLLHRKSPAAYTALANYLRRGNALPADIKIPTKSEVLDAEAKQLLTDGAKQAMREANKVARRLQRLSARPVKATK